MISAETKMKLADCIWVAVAMLHRELPEREGFSRHEILSKMRETGLADGLNANSIHPHLGVLMVANVPTTGTKYLMLYKMMDSDMLRLYRPGDPIDPSRVSRHPRRDLRPPLKSTPRREEILVEYLPLLDWYSAWCIESRWNPASINWENDPLIRLIGSGKHIWADEHADEYVENLRREEPA